MHLIEIESPVRGPRHAQMPVVNRIERPAEKRDAARMMFCGGAVRLRGRQCFSQVVAVINILTNASPMQANCLALTQARHLEARPAPRPAWHHAPVAGCAPARPRWRELNL